MPQTIYTNIDDYHSSFPEQTAQRMQSIRELIHEIATEAEETISYQIPCFTYNGILIYYSAYAKHISLSYPFSAGFWEKFRAALNIYKTSKSAIQFPNNQPLPVDLISKIIVFRKTENIINSRKKEK